jgi:pyridoxal/pyridoxine/pyridoxamine kinase
MGSFDSDSYRPTSDEIEQYLKNLKDNGGCQGVDALLTGHPMDSRITQVGK